MPPEIDIPRIIQEFLGASPYREIVRVLKVVATVVSVLSLIGIFVFNSRRKKVQREFKIEQ